MEPLELIACRLRTALTAQRFTEAQTHFRNYCESLEHELQSLNPADPRAVRISAEAHALFQWSRQTVLSLQSHIKTQLQSTERLAQYLKTGTASRHNWELEA